MTSVLPAWKLELIEKKKKKEQDQRQILEDEKSRKVSIPEWKRSLLEKKKEGSSDSPEISSSEHVSVNSVFGPRILRKASDKTIAIANASQRPVSKFEDGEINKRRVAQQPTTQNHNSASNTVDANSCVTRAVEIPTYVAQKSNKRGSLQQGVVNHVNHAHSENSPRSDVSTPREDLRVSLTLHAEGKTKVGEEDVKAPSVLSYKRMFEQSRPGNKVEISEARSVKTTGSLKADFQSDKWITEGKLDTANFNSKSQNLNKGTGNNAQSIQLKKPTSPPTPETNKPKIASPSSSIAPKPFKNFVTTPPWLKNSSAKSVSFQTAGQSVQEPVVAKVNSEEEKSSKDFHKSDQREEAIVQSDVREIVDKTSSSSDLVISSSAIKPVSENLAGNKAQDLSQDQALYKYSVIKQVNSEDEHFHVKPGKGSENQKYVLINSRSQQKPVSVNEENTSSVSEENLCPVPNEPLLVQHKDDQVGIEDSVSQQSSIDSLRSKFGTSVGFRRRTSSEENLLLNFNQSEPIKQESFLHRRGPSKKNQPAMVRWSADVLSLMSQSIDDDEDDDNVASKLSPRSESKIPSGDSSQAKRPPPPRKRWTADVLSAVSQQADDDVISLSPRTDTSKRSSPSNSLNRARSSSLSDIREEQGFDYFRHNANVSQGIEHRMHKLIRKVSVSETNLNANGGDSDSQSDEDTSGLIDMELNSKEVPNAQDTLKNEIADQTIVDALIVERESKLPPLSPQQEVQPVFARKRSISHDIEHRVVELLHRQLSQQSDGSECEGDQIVESDEKFVTDKVVDKVSEATAEKLKVEPASAVTVEKSPGFVSQTLEVEPKEGPDQSAPESKPTKGSVHKLSALFGSSIWKPIKKDKESSEEKPKDKANSGSKPDKISVAEKPTLAKKEESKEPGLFSKSQKSEGKSGEKKDRESSNMSIFPWQKKQNKDKGKAREGKDKNKKNSRYGSTEQDADSVPIAAHSLRPVHRSEKVEHRLVGKVMIISNASPEKVPPKGVYHKPKQSSQSLDQEQEKEKTAVQKPTTSCLAETKGNEVQIPLVVTQHWNGNQQSPGPESVPVTSIDEVPVSAIDMPEPGESDVAVSVIDVPASPDVHSTGEFMFLNGNPKGATDTDDDDVTVSVIDLPSPVAKEDEPNVFQGGYLETDELSDGSDDDEVEGSYDFATGEVTHLMNGNIAQESDDDDDDDGDDDEEEEDDEEDVPISYIGASPRYKVPQVVFDSEPVPLKSCLSPKVERKKVSLRSGTFSLVHCK